jgi:hypothetical protein
MKRIATAGGVLLCLGAVAGAAGDKPRVFVSDSQSWEISGGFGAVDGSGGGTAKGGARPQRAEIIKTFGERCPQVIVTIKQEKADFVVLLDHEGGKDLYRRDNKIAVFDKDGDAIYSGSTRSLGNAVKDGCHAIVQREARAKVDDGSSSEQVAAKQAARNNPR